MGTMNSKKSLIAQMYLEAQSYNSIEDIEKLVQSGADMAMVPLQPLYISLNSSSSDQVAEILPKLSVKQRKALIDIDTWKKDEVDPLSFEFWIQCYAKAEADEVITEFVSSEDFGLYLRSRLNIYTFDVEDPQYPDHDFYFLTDDTQLLIEYGEDYPYPNELKYLIRNLYDELGVEGAYAHLFKVVNESHLEFEEKQYQSKKERLREFGFVDYYDAVEALHDFVGYKSLDKFIQEKRTVTGEVAAFSRNQCLHSSALISFKNIEDEIEEELSKINDEARQAFLHFTFVRLINSTITLEDALKGGRIELTRISQKTKSILSLGIAYIKQSRSASNVFDDFDFFDIYKIGFSLIQIEKKILKKALGRSVFEQEDREYFLGNWWGSFIENSFLDFPKVKSTGSGLQAKEVSELASFSFWKKEIRLLKDLIPFAESFYGTLAKMREEGLLNDQFYLNYEVANIDFEAILISSLINYSLGNYQNESVNKMGISIVELKSFLDKYFVFVQKEYQLKPQDEIENDLLAFASKFGMSEVSGITEYLYTIIYEHLSGFDYSNLNDEDFKHIGGPILLNTQFKN